MLVPEHLRAPFEKVLEGTLGFSITEDPHFKDTPRRWLNMLRSFCIPYTADGDLSKQFPLSTTGQEIDGGIVIQRGINFAALCAHHLLPFQGKATVAYIPQNKVVGLSKLARLVYGHSHKHPSVQELITNEVADDLMTYLNPIGSACIIEASHGCMTCRGVEQVGTVTTTSALRGAFATNDAARNELLQLL